MLQQLATHLIYDTAFPLAPKILGYFEANVSHPTILSGKFSYYHPKRRLKIKTNSTITLEQTSRES